MKFGRKISTDLYDEWRDKYLDYNGLKKHLKRQTTERQWNSQDEQEFVALLEAELDKIYQFQSKKTKELAERIAAAEGVVQSLVEDYEPDPDYGTPPRIVDEERAIAQESGYDSGSSDGEDEHPDHSDEGSSIDDRFRSLEEEVATLVADVHDLALYTKLNFTGFIKIVKKHDVQDFLDKRPFYKYNWDSLIVKLSKLYDLVRTRGHPVEGDSSAGGSQSAFVRQTTKYWVHADNLVHLKLAILRHLPVLVFNTKKEFEPKDAAITSIYFDNEDLDLYLGRLEKTEGAEAIRLRWYGDTDVKQIFVERKTHREDWTGEKSVKARFPIKEDKVNDYLHGRIIMDDEFEALVSKGKKTAAEAGSMKQLASEVQYSVLTRKLQPVMRTFYNRTAFQLPGDARVRISLDTELTMVREDNWDGRSRAGPNWRRTDIGVDWPFDQLAPEDIEKFPYGILEVKLQTQLGQEPPTWVTDLVNSHLVEAVPKFSKFIHGCATLLPNRVDLVPFWLPQMDTDIRKPDTGALHLERPSAHSSHSESKATSESVTPVSEKNHYSEPLSEGEDDDDMDLAVATEEDKRAGVSFDDAAAAIAFRNLALANEHDRGEPAINSLDGADQNTHTNDVLEAKENAPKPPKPRTLSINPLVSAAAFDQALSSKLRRASMNNSSRGETTADLDEGVGNGSHSVLSSEYRASPGKRIAVPVRVEPKVFFASERTYLMWLQFSVLLGGIATTLLNFTSAEDQIGWIAATAFTATALLSISYSSGVFVYRAFKLRSRDANGLYYDKYGPSALCFALLAALMSNIILRLKEL